MKTFTPEETREHIRILRQEFEGVEECEGAADDLEHLLTQVTVLRQKLKVAREALKPWASYNGEDDRGIKPGILYEQNNGRFCLTDAHGFHVIWSDPARLPVNFTAGQFRRSREAHEASAEEEVGLS